jgi:C-terminal domain 9 of the ABC-three component (ABC-3C) systems
VTQLVRKNRVVTRRVNQKGASASGDIVGGDKIERHYHLAPTPPGIVERLLDKLRAEMEQNEQVRHTIENLAHFQTRRSHDGIDGLENKLVAGGRSHEYPDAIEKKELFAKLLEQWSLYASAQEIFAYLLAKADYEFNRFIYPRISTLDYVEINEEVDSRIVAPLMTECGSSVFTLNHSIVMGMLYWLAEQCFVRWHR